MLTFRAYRIPGMTRLQLNSIVSRYGTIFLITFKVVLETALDRRYSFVDGMACLLITTRRFRRSNVFFDKDYRILTAW
jgi:hypothetical protein